MHTICLGNQGKNTQQGTRHLENPQQDWTKHAQGTLCCVPFSVCKGSQLHLSISHYGSPCSLIFSTCKWRLGPLPPLFPLPLYRFIHSLLGQWILSSKSLRVSVVLGWTQPGWGVLVEEVQAWHQWVTEEQFPPQSRARLWFLIFYPQVFQFLPKSTGFCLLSPGTFAEIFILIRLRVTESHCKQNPTVTLTARTGFSGSSKREVTEKWVHWSCTYIYRHNCLITGIIEVIGIKT